MQNTPSLCVRVTHIVTKSDHADELAPKLLCNQLELSLEVFCYARGTATVGNHCHHHLVLRRRADTNWPRGIVSTCLVYSTMEDQELIYISYTHSMSTCSFMDT